MSRQAIKFHQFVKREKGPVNTALIDMLTGQVYQVENVVIEALDQERYAGIQEFIASAREAELTVHIDKIDWIPPCAGIMENPYEDLLEREFDIELHVEQGVDLEAVLEKLKYHNIEKVVYYGPEVPRVKGKETIESKEKNFTACIARSHVTAEFEPVTEHMYTFNKEHNSCWSNKIAITGDGKVRPCIYSTVIIGDIHDDHIDDILEDLEKRYWSFTKDKVVKCKDCELRYVCFDCRETALREGGDLNSPNPGCKYDPYKGSWNS